MKILNLSLYAALLIPVVMLLRVLFRKAPKWILCLFWALVAVRLLCPVTIESPFSLMPASEKLPIANYAMTENAQSEMALETPIQNASVVLDAGSVDLQTEAATAGRSIAELKEVQTAANASVAESIAQSGAGAKKADPVKVFAIIWLVGFLVMMGQALFSFLRLKTSVAASVKVRRNIRVCDEIQYPFILGIVRPMIYLPGFLEGSMKRFVLAHERAHLNRHDHWWKPLGFFLLAIHWFNPLCWIAYILFCRDLEMACDERVIRNMDRESKADYSQTLLLLSSPASRIAACPVAFGEIGVKERVKGIINYKKPAVWIVLLALVGCAVMAVCFLTSPSKTDTKAAQDKEVQAEAMQEETEQSAAVTDTTKEEPTELKITEAANGEDAVVVTEADEDVKVMELEPASKNLAIAGDVVYSADIDGNGVEDSIYMQMLPDDEITDEHSIDWSLVLNGEAIGNGSHALPCDFDSWSLDLDGDNKEELLIRIMPHVNSMPLEEYVVFKQTGDQWTQLQNTSEFGQVDGNNDLSNAFPVSVTVGEKPGTLDIQVDGAQKFTVDVKKHYENVLKNQDATEFHAIADGFLNGGKYAAGEEFGTTADWGIWKIEAAAIDGVPCVRATQGIESKEGGKFDILGTMEIYFNYGQDGKINILKTDFTQSVDGTFTLD